MSGAIDLFQIAEAGEDLGQACQVLGVLVGAVGDLGPGGLGFVGPFEVMEVFTDVFVILGIGRCQLGGLSVEGQGIVGQFGLAQQVGDLGGG